MAISHVNITNSKNTISSARLSDANSDTLLARKFGSDAPIPEFVKGGCRAGPPAWGRGVSDDHRLTGTCLHRKTPGRLRPGACEPSFCFGRSRAADQSAPLRAAPGLKRTDLDALILIAAPVRGLRPVRAARLVTVNVPKPTS